MRTLFAKIMLWFVATIAITFIGLAVIPAIGINDPGRRPPMARAFSFHVYQAGRAYETGGPSALAAFLADMKEYAQADAFLTDAQGRDLLTGDDRSEWIAAGRGRFWFWLSSPRTTLARRSENGRYWLILLIPPENVRRWVFLPGQLWILGAGIVLCYLLALYLTSPLRTIEKALERFGTGDFSARTRSKRRDELGHLARTFDQMAERIQTLVAADRRLLLDISHELRSPLARLGVAVELARSGEDREAALNRIQKESDRLNALVGELLQVTRAEVDPNTLHREPVRLDELLADIVDDCSIETQQRQISLRLDAPDAITVDGDEEMLRRAIENIIRNAIRYAPEKTAVEVTLHPQGTMAAVQVRDYGPGVPEESLARIFDPFYRVEGDRNRSSGGVGLGLAIARRAIELHDGKLTARNTLPGLLVEVELRKQAPAAAVEPVTILRA